jgi:hypothetical protein
MKTCTWRIGTNSVSYADPFTSLVRSETLHFCVIRRAFAFFVGHGETFLSQNPTEQQFVYNLAVRRAEDAAAEAFSENDPNGVDIPTIATEKVVVATEKRADGQGLSVASASAPRDSYTMPTSPTTPAPFV